MENKYEKLLNKIKELTEEYDEDFHEGEYWDSGNFDDCFALGQTSGRNEVYKELKDIIEEIEKIEEK